MNGVGSGWSNWEGGNTAAAEASATNGYGMYADDDSSGSQYAVENGGWSWKLGARNAARTTFCCDYTGFTTEFYF